MRSENEEEDLSGTAHPAREVFDFCPPNLDSFRSFFHDRRRVHIPPASMLSGCLPPVVAASLATPSVRRAVFRGRPIIGVCFSWQPLRENRWLHSYAIALGSLSQRSYAVFDWPVCADAFMAGTTG